MTWEVNALLLIIEAFSIKMNECHLRIACKQAPVASQCGTCFTVGGVRGGTERENEFEIALGSEKREVGANDRQTEREGERKSPGKWFSLAQDPWSPPSQHPPPPSQSLCLHTQKFRTISQLPIQWPVKGDRFLPGYSPAIQRRRLLSWENANLWHPRRVGGPRVAITAFAANGGPRVTNPGCEDLCVCVREVKGALPG